MGIGHEHYHGFWDWHSLNNNRGLPLEKLSTPYVDNFHLTAIKTYIIFAYVHETHERITQHYFMEFIMKAEVLKALVHFASVNTSSFVGFQYQNEYEVSHVTMRLGTNLEKAYQDDLDTLLANRATFEQEPIYLAAIDEMIASLRNSLEKGIGNNDSYTKKDVYEQLAPNVKMHKETGALYVSGFQHRKTLIETLKERKAVKSSEKTIAKRTIAKRLALKKDTFREYIIDEQHMGRVRIKGNTLYIGNFIPEEVA